MDTVIVESKDDFAKYFHILKQRASMGTNPNIYVIGFDVEFICKENYPEAHSRADTWVHAVRNHVACTIQVATEDFCMLINLVKLKNDLHKQIYNIISSPSWVKVGVGIDTDLTILSDNYNLGHCSGGLDLKNLGIMAGIRTPSLEHMYSSVTGEHVKKTCGLCDWSEELTHEQVSYALKDAVMSYKLGMDMLKPSIDALSIVPNRNPTSSMKINILNKQSKNIHNKNYIGMLQEIAQGCGHVLPVYTWQEHNPGFKSVCAFRGASTTGTGASKKSAKQRAAKVMLELYQEN